MRRLPPILAFGAGVVFAGKFEDAYNAGVGSWPSVWVVAAVLALFIALDLAERQE
ncbi:hypothetical protein [Microvirga sp. Mcv34]|uniref:hypothetical protein n=1 Tax=Microvirga sp. Mcv34 TaxID=2926016 RepID=UPI0021CAC579|nr:hypothetical protein [Microvirga sp. Mcv34]